MLPSKCRMKSSLTVMKYWTLNTNDASVTKCQRRFKQPKYLFWKKRHERRVIPSILTRCTHTVFTSKQSHNLRRLALRSWVLQICVIHLWDGSWVIILSGSGCRSITSFPCTCTTWLSPVASSHIPSHSGQQRLSRGIVGNHTFCILTTGIRHRLAAVEAEALVVISSDVECATCRRTAKGERSRQVIQDYSDDMSFPWTCYFCWSVFCVKHGAQTHLSAPNSPLAPINGTPWTSIDEEIMSSRCLVNAVPYFLPDSHAPQLPFASFAVCRALR